MKKITKMLSWILAVCMLLTCLAVPTFAADEAAAPAAPAAEEEKPKTIDDYPAEAYILDANDKKSIEAVSGLKASTTNTNEKAFVGEWAIKKPNQLQFTAIKDINGFDTVEFYLRGDADHPTTLRFLVWAENPETDGSDYYDGGNFEVKPGWNKYTFKLSEIVGKKTRTPKPMNEIDHIDLYATGWGLEKTNDFENTVLYIDSIKLVKGEKLLTAPAVKVPETEAGTVKYYDYNFDGDEDWAKKGFGMTPKSNKIEVKKDKDNGYVSIEGLGTDDDYFVQVASIKGCHRYVVMQSDFKVDAIDTSVTLFNGRDAANVQNPFVQINKEGKIFGGGKQFGDVPMGKWFNVAVCVDLDNHTYDVYVDGKKVGEGVPTAKADLGRIVLVRTFISPKSNVKMSVDNYRMFDGKTPEDYEKAVDAPGSAATTESAKIDVNTTATPAYDQVKSNAVAEVKDAVCLKVNSPFALVRHEQKPIDANNKDVAPFVINGRTLVPVRFIAEAFGAEVAWDGDTRTVTIKKDSDVLTLVIGTNVINKNGTDITIDVPAEIYNERTMLPLRAVTENLGKKVFWDDMGLIIISDNEINFTKEKDLAKMLDIMSGFIYERPGQEKLKADLLAKTPGHPRLLATAEDFQRIKEYLTYDENIQKWVASLIKVADNYVTAAPNEAEHTYAADAGGRLANSYAIHEKATSLGMAYQLTGDKKYPEAMWYTLKDMCKWEHWHPGHFLNASDCMLGISIAYDWMYDAWTPEQKTIIEEALYDCGIEDSITAYHGATDYISPPMDKGHRSGWFRWSSNWNAHCNAGVMGVGIAMATHEKYGDLAIKCIDYSMNSMELGLRCYAPDGGYEEGVAYWPYGTNYAVMLMESLSKACGTSYGLTDAPGFSATYATPLYMESKIGSFNFSDSAVGRSNTSFLFWWGKEYNNPQVNGIRFNELATGEKSSSYSDILFYNPENIDKNASLALDYKFFGTDTFTMRSSWTDPNQLFGGLHGGSNEAGHCNIDSGVFVLESLGNRWFIDLGSDNYNLDDYWSKGVGGARWQYYSQRAEGHNCFVINPGTAEEQEVKSVSRIIDFSSKPRGAYGKIDLTAAYKKEVTKATRGMMFAANRKAAIVQDEITMKAPSEFWWFAHTKAEIEVAADGRSATLTQGGKKLHVQIVSDNADFKFTVMDAVSLPTSPVPAYKNGQKENPRAGVRKLAIHASGVENVKLAVVCQPIINGEVEYKYTYTDLDNWYVPDGEILTPELTDIKVNGASIEGFKASETVQEVVLPFGTTAVPEVVATPDAVSDALVVLPEKLPGTATIKVTNKEDPTMYSLYSVFMRAAEDIEIEVSDAQDGNPGSQCLDKKLDTRWAVENDAWGIFHFANPKTISSVWVATWKASERKLIFDIEVSEDGVNFKQVWSGQSSIDKDELEEFKIPEGTYKAVKLVLHGTTTGTWNSLLEVEFK